MKTKIDIKTIGGVAVGAGVGFFLFKTKNPLILLALGVGGGLAANYLIKTKGEKIEDAEKSVEKYAKEVEKDIEATIDTGEEKLEGSDNASSVEGMAFNPDVGYITPTGTVDERKPEQYLDLEF